MHQPNSSADSSALDRIIRAFAAVLACTAFVAAVPTAAADEDLNRPVFLVASPKLADTPFQDAVLIAVPFGQGEHVGFILNKPTDTRLSALFPEHMPSRQVKSPVYIGGPVMPQVLFAVVREADKPAQGVMQLMPGLVFVSGEAAVDSVIEKTPNRARYFAGLMGWRPGELEAQVDEKYWTVRDADASALFGDEGGTSAPRSR
jgi:putative transcriptional regulator